MVQCRLASGCPLLRKLAGALPWIALVTIEMNTVITTILPHSRRTMGRLAGALFLLLLAGSASPQTAMATVRVATGAVRSFVFDEGGELK